MLTGAGSTNSQHMEAAGFTIPTSSLLARVVNMIDDVPFGGGSFETRA